MLNGLLLNHTLLLDEFTGHRAGINCFDIKSVTGPDGKPDPNAIFIITGGDEHESNVRMFTFIEDTDGQQ